MASSYRLFRFAGIDVDVHVSFIFFFLLLALTGGANVFFYVVVFGVVLLHEFSHSMVSQFFRIKVNRIVLLPIGGMANIELPQDPVKELLISAAGPAFNFVFAGACFLGLMWLGAGVGDYGAIMDGVDSGALSALSPPVALSILFYVNMVLGLFNVLPAFPMDGGRLLRSVLALWMDYFQATRVAISVGQLMFLLLIVAGFLLPNFWWVVMGVFLFYSGSGELNVLRLKQAYEGVAVESLMLRNFRFVDGSVSVGDFLRLVVSPGLRYYIVVDGSGNFRGVVDAESLARGGSAVAKDLIATHVAHGYGVVDAGSRVDLAFKTLLSAPVTLIVSGGSVVGLVTASDVWENTSFYLQKRGKKRQA
ncbi:Zinc metalloprotease [uncultured archaeon]|nr:Zinc metalloprotease [uncultured archaeon]